MRRLSRTTSKWALERLMRQAMIDPHVIVEVKDCEIIATILGTSFQAIYRKSPPPAQESAPA
jgi:hypothetical protein